MSNSRALLLIGAAALVAGMAAWLVVPEGEAASESPRNVASPAEPRSEPASAESRRAETARNESRTQPSIIPAPTPIAPPAVDRWSSDDPVGIVVYGTLRDSAGKTIPQASLAAAREGSPPINTRASGEGSYSFAGLAPGIVRITARSEAFVTLEQDLVLTESPTFRRIDLVMKPLLRIAIRFVAPDGRPLSAALEAKGTKLGPLSPLMAYASRAAPPKELAATANRGYETSEIAEWRDALFSRVGRDLPPKGTDGILLVREPPPFFVSVLFRHCVLTTVEVKSPTSELDLTVAPETLEATFGSARMRLVDAETGKPAEKAQATLNDRQTGGGYRAADADGVVTLERLAPGILQLDAMAPGYANDRRFVKLEAGQRLDLGDVKLSRPRAIAGKVVDPSGGAVKGVVSIDGPLNDDRIGEGDFRLNAQVQEDGSFSHPNAAPGRYVLRYASKGITSLPLLVDVSQGSREDLRISCVAATTATFEYRVSPDDGITIKIATADGLVIRAARPNGRATSWPVELAPGAYVLTVSGPTGLSKTLPFTIGAAPLTLKAWP